MHLTRVIWIRFSQENYMQNTILHNLWLVSDPL